MLIIQANYLLILLLCSFGVHAYGYTTVKNNGVDYYHYTRVQIQNIDTQYVHCSKTESGYGRVDADTGVIWRPDENSEGRIYYGW